MVTVKVIDKIIDHLKLIFRKILACDSLNAQDNLFKKHQLFESVLIRLLCPDVASRFKIY